MMGKTISVSAQTLEALITGIIMYIDSLDRKLTLQQYYEVYILRQIWARMRTKEMKMIHNGRSRTKINFDGLEALLITTVLQKREWTIGLNDLMMELGSIVVTYKAEEQKTSTEKILAVTKDGLYMLRMSHFGSTLPADYTYQKAILGNDVGWYIRTALEHYDFVEILSAKEKN